MQSVSYRIDGGVAGTHTEKNLYVRIRTFILMSFSPFHLSFSSRVRFVPRFGRSMKIHFLSSLPFLFFRSHIIITVTRCLFIFFLFPPFFLLTFLLFYVHLFYCRFFAPCSLPMCISKKTRRRRQEGTLKCVDKAHTHTRSFDFMSSKTFQPTPSLDGRNMSARNDNSDGIVIRSHLARMCAGDIGASSSSAAAATTTTTHK